MQKAKNNVETFPPMKKNGYAIILDKQLENGMDIDLVHSIVNSKDCNHFYDSKIIETYKEMYVNSFRFIKEDYIKQNGKSKISEKITNSMKSLAFNFVFMMFDDLHKDDERRWELDNIIESYFDGNKTNFVLGLWFAFTQTEIK